MKSNNDPIVFVRGIYDVKYRIKTREKYYVGGKIFWLQKIEYQGLKEKIVGLNSSWSQTRVLK